MNGNESNTEVYEMVETLRTSVVHLINTMSTVLRQPMAHEINS